MPLWILLIPYALFLIIFTLFALIDLYHAFRFRSGFFSALFLIVFFILGTMVILVFSWNLLAPVDWFYNINFVSNTQLGF